MASNGQLYSMLYDNVMKLLTTGKIVPDQLGSEIQKMHNMFQNYYSQLYTKGYILKEQRNYYVKSGFPRIIRSDVPHGACNIKYEVSLSTCSEFQVDWDRVIAAIKEYEYGQAGGTQ